MNDSLRRAIADGDFEVTESGLAVPKLRTLVQGIVKYSKRGEPEETVHNLVVDQGLQYLLASALGSVSPIGNWYVAVFTGDVSVGSGWTASNFASSATEFTQYENPSRPSWTRGSITNAHTDSFASKAEFKSTTNGAQLRGAALISSSAKGGTAGTLLGATRFTSTKPLDEDEILDVGYGVNLTVLT